MRKAKDDYKDRMTRKEKAALEAYRRDSITVAAELCYGLDIMRKIRDAKTEIEIENALISGRKRMQ